MEHACELGSRTDSELGVDVRQVTRDGAFTQEERRCDLFVRPALRDESCNALFGRGQASFTRAAPDASELRLTSLDPGRRAELGPIRIVEAVSSASEREGT